MAVKVEEKLQQVTESGEEGDYTEDGTVDLKGRPVLRSNTGRWKACSFIVGYEVFERMAYYGISTNLILYLTRKLHEGTVTSSNNVTNWVGTVWLTPILGAYIADAYLGRYWTFAFASAIYFMGMSLLTLAVSVPGLRPPSCGPGIKDQYCNKRATGLQKGIFFCALYIIAVGTGGTKPNISTIGADQFDVFEPKERAQKLSFFNWWMFSIFFGTLFANVILVYIQDKLGWALGYGLPTVGLGISIFVFFVGTKFYRHRLPSGSPVTTISMVLAAAFRNRKLTLPSDTKDLYELSSEEYTKSRKFMIQNTHSFRFLDKAAVRTGPNLTRNLCTVTQVEETKQMLKMLPILAATFTPSAVIAQCSTLFIKQGTTLDRALGPHFHIPPASFSAFTTVSLLLSLVIYDRLFVPFAKRFTQNPRGISLLQRLGTGLVLNVIVMAVASLMERKRLAVAREHGALTKDDIVPLSVFVLLPQFALAGVAESFVETAKLEFFYDQAPQGMKSLGTSYFTSSIGIGHFLSTFILTTVAKHTKRHGKRGWILNNLNVSRLDNYFAFLAFLSIINFFFFLLVAKMFVYNVDETESKREEGFAAEANSSEKPSVQSAI